MTSEVKGGREKERKLNHRRTALGVCGYYSHAANKTYEGSIMNKL